MFIAVSEDTCNKEQPESSVEWKPDAVDSWTDSSSKSGKLYSLNLGSYEENNMTTPVFTYTEYDLQFHLYPVEITILCMTDQRWLIKFGC